MTIENARLLLKTMQSDTTLAEKIQATNPDSFEQTTQELGFPCSAEEVREVIKNFVDNGGELTEKQLEYVSGGNQNWG